MTSLVAYVSRKWFTTSFQKDSMTSGLSEKFSFVRYRRDANDTVADVVMKNFTHHMAGHSWITLVSDACLKVARKLRMEIKSPGRRCSSSFVPEDSVDTWRTNSRLLLNRPMRGRVACTCGTATSCGTANSPRAGQI